MSVPLLGVQNPQFEPPMRVHMRPWRKLYTHWKCYSWQNYCTRRMAIANRTCVSFCNQPKAHFGLPWVRPWTIAVNVTWVEREFNAGQTHRSMCPSLFNPLRAIARYWSEIATFSYPLAFNAPIWVFPLESRGKFGPEKTNIMGLPGSEDRLTIGWAVSTQYLNMYDWRTLKT